uniref:Uncharacterized protein n=1 Tax=Glossina pallidipes TaxID=7398 RepID=A0A1A9ZQN3_GLOPL
MERRLKWYGCVLAFEIVGGFESTSVSPKNLKFLAGCAGTAVVLLGACCRVEGLARFILLDGFTFSLDLLFDLLSKDLNQLIFSGLLANDDSLWVLSIGDEVRFIRSGLALGVDNRRRIDISMPCNKGNRYNTNKRNETHRVSAAIRKTNKFDMKFESN